MKPINEFINESRKSDILLSLVNIYLKNIDRLDYQHQQHFLNRLKLCNTFKCNAEMLISELNLANLVKENVEALTNHLLLDDIDDLYKTHILELYNSTIDKRKSDVYKYLLSNESPQFKKTLLFGILVEQFSVLLKMHPDMDGNLWNDMKTIIGENWNSLLEIASDKNSLLSIPVNIINLLYYTKYCCECLQMNDLLASLDTLIEKSTETLLSEFYNNPNLNLAYGLTHVIIGESSFYTRALHNDTSQYLIGDAIAKYIMNGEELTNDFLCEAAVCLKLIDEDHYILYINHVKEKMFSVLERNSILHNFSPGLQKNEHTNILFILLNCLSLY